MKLQNWRRKSLEIKIYKAHYQGCINELELSFVYRRLFFLIDFGMGFDPLQQILWTKSAK